MKTQDFLKGAGLCAMLGLMMTMTGCDGGPTAEAGSPVQKEPIAVGETLPQREVEICFVLDTTGSMAGLIDGAKKKIWSIANEIVTAHPGAKVSMGLIGYRDRGDIYVTKRFPLSQDIDTLYEHLLGFSADGGNDTPESVNQALAEAVDQMEWSKSQKVLKLIFLVGDAPPHMDYKDDIPYPESCKKAASQGIIINTVQCGEISSTTPIWTAIAKGADGKYVALPQDGNMKMVETPMDEKLAELNRKVGRTLVPYGSDAQKLEVTGKQSRSEAASAGVAASRLSYNGKTGKTVQGQGDLIDDLRDKKVNLKDLPKNQLPSGMQGKKEAEMKEALEKMERERAVVQQEILKVSKEREAWLADYDKKQKAAGATEDSFDANVNGIISEQSKKVFEE